MKRRNRYSYILFFVIIFLILLINFFLVIYLNEAFNGGRRLLTVTIENAIHKEYNHLPSYLRNKTPGKTELDKKIELFIHNLKNGNKRKLVNATQLWKLADSWVTQSRLFDPSHPKIGELCHALKSAPIIKADVDNRGSQLKLFLTLEGNQHVVFKPKWYEKDKTFTGLIYAGKDRYGSEILAFYLSVLLNKPLTAPSIERDISFKYDVFPNAARRLMLASYENENATCIYGSCFYCRKTEPVCTKPEGLMRGAVIINIKGSFRTTMSPWTRTYVLEKKAVWEKDNNFCKFVKSKFPISKILEFVDISIFDFLIQNGDRHHYEALNNTILLLDNGKGLGNPYRHQVDILAPLYQCCTLRRSTYKTLKNLAGGKLTDYLEQMPDIKHFLSKDHFIALEKRLLIIFATVQYCSKNKNLIFYD